MDIHEILEHLPHRYPFLLIDRVTDCKPGESLVGYKNVSFNEPYFTGHFPQRPVMPGVLILEALAQATGILAFRTLERTPDDNSLYYYRKPVNLAEEILIRSSTIIQAGELDQVYLDGNLPFAKSGMKTTGYSKPFAL